jgi:cell division septal protein FtsQ
MSKYSSTKRKKRSRLQAYLSTPVLIVLGGIVVLAAALFAFWRSQQTSLDKVQIEVSGQPSLRVDQELVDLGDVRLGETVTVDFTLANVGDETLRFEARPYVEVMEGC